VKLRLHAVPAAGGEEHAEGDPIICGGRDHLHVAVEALPRFHDGSVEPLSDLRLPPIGPANLRPIVGVLPFNVRTGSSDERLGVPMFTVDLSQDGLEALLRHRPPSISRGGKVVRLP
jgi:hypothetical protein